MDQLVELLSFVQASHIELTLWKAAALVAAGVLGGFLNTVAGGGSMVTVPTLMLLGMPADYANGTNRVGVLQQSLIGVRGFNRSGKLDRSAIAPMLVVTSLGAAFGALASTWLPPDVLKPVMLGAMIAIALVMLLAPDVVEPPEDASAHSLRERPMAGLALFGAGVYGGFVQAGVGLVLIVSLAGVLRYDLVRANALKVVCTALFSVVALVVFISTGRVEWVTGILLAAGMTIGAAIGVRFALNVEQRTFRWVLFAIVCVSCGSALVFA